MVDEVEDLKDLVTGPSRLGPGRIAKRAPDETPFDISDDEARAARAKAAPQGPPRKIGIADTTFARMDMGGAAARAIQQSDWSGRIEVIRVTVPGFKDLPVACKRLIEERDCEVVIACGQAGGAPIDKQCAHEASQGLMLAQLMTNRHILEVFVHTDEVEPHEGAKLKWLGEERAREHALNALWLLFEPERLAKMAGTGQRQGFQDEGPIR